MVRLFLGVFLFLYIFAPLLRLGRFSANTMLFLFVISTAYLLVNYLLSISTYSTHSRSLFSNIIRINIFKKILIFVLIPTFLCLIYFFMISFGRGSFVDLSFIKMLIYALISFPPAYLIYLLYARQYQGNAWRYLLHDLVSVGVFHVLIMLLFLFYPNLIREFNKLLNLEESLKLLSLGVDYRSYGVSSYGGAVLSAFYASLIFIEWLVDKNRGITFLLKKILRTSLLVIGIFISGRTGLIVVGYFLAILIIFGGIKFSNILTKRWVRTILWAMLLLIVAGLFITVLGDTRTVVFTRVVERTFEFYFKYVDQGVIATDSTTAIFETHYFFPEDPLDLVFGTGDFGRSANGRRIATDPGITRAIWGAGILGLFVLLIPNLGFLYLSRFVPHKGLKILLVSVVFLIPLLNFKELFFVGTLGLTTQVLWLLTITGLGANEQIQSVKVKPTPLEGQQYPRQIKSIPS